MDPEVVNFSHANEKKTILFYTSKKTLKLGMDSMRIIREILNNPFTVDQGHLDNVKLAMCALFNLKEVHKMRLNVLIDGFYITNSDHSLHVVMTTDIEGGFQAKTNLIQGRFKYLNLFPHRTMDILQMALSK